MAHPLSVWSRTIQVNYSHRDTCQDLQTSGLPRKEPRLPRRERENIKPTSLETKTMKSDRWRYATCTIDAAEDNGISTVRVKGLVSPSVVIQAVANNAEWLQKVNAASQVIDLRKMSAGFTAREAFDLVRAVISQGRTATPAAFIVPGGVMRPVTVYCFLMESIGICRIAFETEPEAQAWALRHARRARTQRAGSESLESQR
jgi:hypothetical protein